MSKTHVFKDIKGNWKYHNDRMKFCQSTSTTIFMEGRLGICADIEAIVMLPVEDHPNEKIHVHVKGYNILNVSLVSVNDDNSTVTLDVDEFFFES